MTTVLIAGAALLLIVFIAYSNGKAKTKEKQSDDTLKRVARSKKNRELSGNKSIIDKLRSISKNRNK